MHTGEQRALLRLVREVSRRQIAPRAADHTNAAGAQAELFALLAELDLLGLPFPRADGGRGQPVAVVCHVLAELSQASLAIGLGTSTHLWSTQVVADHAAPRIRAEILPRLISGEWLAAHALSPDREGRATARAVRDGDWYVLDGAAEVAPSGGRADCYVVGCRSADGEGVVDTVLLVPSDLPGLVDDEVGRVDTPSAGQVRWSALRVPVDNRLGSEGDGDMIADGALDRANLGVAACAMGLARAALEAAVVCVRRAAQQGASKAVAPAALVADLAAAVEAAVALCDRAARACDAGDAIAVLAAMARQAATATALRVAEHAVEIERDTTVVTAGLGTRYLREAVGLRLVDGGEHGPRETIARTLLG